jgi:hypothetical protein
MDFSTGSNSFYRFGFGTVKFRGFEPVAIPI